MKAHGIEVITFESFNDADTFGQRKQMAYRELELIMQNLKVSTSFIQESDFYISIFNYFKIIYRFI